MKITQIVASIEERHNDPSRSVRGLADGLAEAGHTVELLSTAHDGNGAARIEGNLSVRIFSRGRPARLCPAPDLRNHLRQADTELVHNHGLWLRPLHHAHLAAAQKGIPLVISPRGMMSPWAWNHHRLQKRLASWWVHPGALAAAAGWHATSESEADDIRRLGFNQPVCVAPNGVEPPSAKKEAAEARHWLERLPVLAGRRVALFYSRFHAKKRVLELIDLWLSQSRGDWVLLIVGIPEEYTVNQLDSYVARNACRDRIIVEDGTRHPPPYAAASLFLLPSHSENFGLVVAESLVRGVPVLATDTTPWQDLDHIGAGRCVTWDDYGRTLDTLLRESPETLAACGQRGRAWAREEFSWGKTAGMLATFYAELRAAAG